MTIPTDQIFSEWGRDVIGVFGFSGTIFSFLYFGYQQWENRKKTSEAIKALEDAKARQDRFLLTQLLKIVSDAQFFANSQSFEIMSIRLGDAAHLLSQINSGFPFRNEQIENLHNFKSWATRVHNGTNKRSVFLKKWSTFEATFSTAISQEIKKMVEKS